MFATIYSALEKAQFNGAIYVESPNAGSISLTLGYKDLNHSSTITENTLFDIASLSKMYTAVMALQLLEQKAIRLEDTLSNWFDMTNACKQVTIEHLLTHTSGIPEYIGNTSCEDIAEFLRDKQPYFPAGCGWSYSNTNYVLLAKMIEHTSQLSYEDYLQKMIAAPLQLQHTTSQPAAEHVAVGRLFDYTKRNYIALADDPIFKGIDTQHGFYGDGGIYSTAKDIARFVKGFLHGKLVSPEWVRRAVTPTASRPNYGYGFVLQDGAFGHSGGWPGYSAHCLCSLDGDQITVLLTNEEVSPIYEQQLLAFLNDPHDSEEPLPPKHPGILLPDASDRIEGTYQLADEVHTRFTIKRDDDHFIVSFQDQHDTHLFKIEPNVYWIRNTMSCINMRERIFMDEGAEIPFHQQ